VAAAVAAALVAVLGLLARDRPAHWLVLEDEPAAEDAAVVLAGDPEYERTTAGSRLVLSGRCRLLILTGGEEGPGDGAPSLREHALGLGVPPDRIRMESASHSTRESLVNVLPILRKEGVRSVALVTSPYHQRRAYLAARRAWPAEVAIRNRPARPSVWAPRDWWRDAWSRKVVVSEYGKLVYYALRRWL
jgi:uncharacterized SAM-binding protein YcdF (DUF218 family)